MSAYIDATCIGIEAIRNYIWNNSIASHLGPCVKLFNREILKDFNIRFPKDVSNGEDTIFVFEYLSNVQELSVFESRNYIYRDVSGSLSHRIKSENITLNNYLRLRDSWASFSGISINDSRLWVNGPLQPQLNSYILSLFADNRLGFSYRLSHIKRYREELLAMYKYSEINTSTIGRISSILLGCKQYILYIMCYFVFVRYHLKLNVG